MSNAFWLWFWRPIAETAANLLMVLVMLGVMLLAISIWQWFDARATRKRQAAALAKTEAFLKAREDGKRPL